MSTRLKIADSRWFADKRPVCVIENEAKRRFEAKNDFEYAEKLQKNGLVLFEEMVRKIPKITVSASNQ